MRSVTVKTGAHGETVAHPGVAPGSAPGGYFTRIDNVPDTVSDAELLVLFRQVATWNRPVVDYAELRPGALLRAADKPKEG